MKRTVAILVILTSFSVSTYGRTDTTIKGVQISFSYSNKIFPEFWREEPINAVAEPIPSEEVQRSKTIMAKALSKYPQMAVAKELKKVYFLKAMKFYDVGYGGTNSDDALYLTNNGQSMGYTDLYLEQTFHHEFSSILYRNHPSYFKERDWQRSNNPEFTYTDPEKGVGAIRNNQSSQELDTTLCKEGFLTEYATSGMENDFNTFAQNLFSPTPGFWEIVDKYPRIRRKVKLIVAFYQKVHPVFTMKYFRELNK